MGACLNGNVEVAQLLCTHGAHINMTDMVRLTCIIRPLKPVHSLLSQYPRTHSLTHTFHYTGCPWPPIRCMYQSTVREVGTTLRAAIQ